MDYQNKIIIRQNQINEMLFNDENQPLARNALELEATLTQKIIEEEALFREAIKRQLFEGDDLVRDRMISKIKLLIEEELQNRHEPDKQELHQWWENNLNQYSTPVRLSAHHYFIHAEKSDEIDFRSLQLKRNISDPSQAHKLGDVYEEGHRFHGYTINQFNHALKTDISGLFSPFRKNKWLGPIQSDAGFHWIYVDAVQELRQQKFTEVVDLVKRDLKEFKYKNQKRKCLNRIISSYNIVYEE